jgi:hypothetical protein
MVLCKNCRWCERPTDPDARCQHPQASYESTQVVTGAVETHHWACEVFRSPLSACGPDAKLFEPKEG